jgi:hypothetical protein
MHRAGRSAAGEKGAGMSTTPPEQGGMGSGGASTGGGGGMGGGTGSGGGGMGGRGPDVPMGYTIGSPGSIARLPLPGNAEFGVYLVIEVIFVILWVATDVVDAYRWMVWTTVLTAAYLLSRGIAKASRVLEA